MTLGGQVLIVTQNATGCIKQTQCVLRWESHGRDTRNRNRQRAEAQESCASAKVMSTWNVLLYMVAFRLRRVWGCAAAPPLKSLLIVITVTVIRWTRCGAPRSKAASLRSWFSEALNFVILCKFSYTHSRRERVLSNRSLPFHGVRIYKQSTS